MVDWLKADPPQLHRILYEFLENLRWWWWCFFLFFHIKIDVCFIGFSV